VAAEPVGELVGRGVQLPVGVPRAVVVDDGVVVEDELTSPKRRTRA